MESKKEIQLPGPFRDRFRYLVLLLSLLCLTSISSNMLTFNFSIICMTPQRSPNGTVLESEHFTYDYSKTQQSALIWAVGAGSMVGTFPFSYFYSKYGARHSFLAAGLLSVVATVFTPLAASLGFVWFLVVRFLQGISYAADFAAIGMLCSRWASLKQNAFYISVLTCYSPLSSTLTNAFSGYICESALGWPFIYYCHAAFGLAIFLYWFYMYNDYPALNIRVSAVELEKIERGKGKEQLELSSYVPLKQILTNPVVLTIWYNAFAEIASAVFLVTYTPIYLRNVHGFSVEMTGLLSSIPTLCNMPVRIFLGWISDKIKFWSERTKLNIFNTFSVLGPAACYGLIGFTSEDSHLLAVTLLTLISFFYAGSGGGFYKCSTLTCRQYSQFVIANIQFIKCITLFISPLLYAIFIRDASSQSDWRSIFLIITVAQLLATILFLYFSTDQPQDFTKTEKPKTKVSVISEPNAF